jgi:hypothetical protein
VPEKATQQEVEARRRHRSLVRHLYIPYSGDRFRAAAILCLQEERRVGNDYTVKWRGSLCKSRPGRCARILCAPRCAHEYPDGRLAIFHGPHRLAGHDQDGNLRDDTKLVVRPAYAAFGFVDNAARCPQPHGVNHHRSGQLMRYGRYEERVT